MIEVPGLSLIQERIFKEVKTRDQAVTYLEHLIERVHKARAEMDGAKMVEVQRKAFHNLLVRYGIAIGALLTLVHARILNDGDFDRFAPRIYGAITARLVNL